MRAASAEELLNVGQSGTIGHLADISIFAYVEGAILSPSVEKCLCEPRMMLSVVPKVGLVLHVGRELGRTRRVTSSVGRVPRELTLD